jgi:hypothetical protein
MRHPRQRDPERTATWIALGLSLVVGITVINGTDYLTGYPYPANGLAQLAHDLTRVVLGAVLGGLAVDLDRS